MGLLYETNLYYVAQNDRTISPQEGFQLLNFISHLVSHLVMKPIDP